LHPGGCQQPGFSDDDISIRISPLLTAVTTGNVQPEITELLLQFGAKTETRTRDGTTALHEVVTLQREDLAGLLINHGADVDAGVQQEKFEGCTSLHFAAGTSDLKMAELLLGHGANLTAASAHGWTPLDVALLDRQVTMAHYLIARSSLTAPSFPQPGSHESTTKVNKESRELVLHLLTNGIAYANS
jgi:ankyrin repeat protein